jgi:transcriptional regulator with XRE-family HTH domain
MPYVKEKIMDTLKIMGERLCILRKERNLRQADIAELLHLTQAHYQRVEKGKVNIPTLTLCTLADYFGVTTEYLLGRSDQRS